MANRFKGTWNLFTQYIVDLQQDTAHSLEWTCDDAEETDKKNHRKNGILYL